MKVSLKNVGMLDEANFEVGNLTIICGENNTGKTYATYSLYGYLDYMRNIREVPYYRARGDISDNVEHDDIQEIKLTYNKIKERLQKHMLNKSKMYEEYFLIGVMAGKEDDFANLEFNVEISISMDEIKDAINVFLISDNLLVRAKRRFEHILYDDGLIIKPINGIIGKRYIADYMNLLSDALLHIILRNNFILSVERTGASIFQEELDFTKIAKLETLKRMARDEDVDVFEILDEKKQLYPKPVRDNINFIRSLKQLSKKDSCFKEDNSKNQEILKVLSNLVGGKYKVTDIGILFQPKKSRKGYNIEIASSSVRSLLMLNFYILNTASKKDILMIDEPELNLHPNNQILVARLLVLLANAGIKVFITTHSDYIVREISNCVMLGSLTDDQIDKFKNKGYTKEYKINHQKVKAYLAENKKGKNILSSVDINERGIFMNTFDSPIDTQNENQSLIFAALLESNKNDK
ncbi:AAA family ATPase [Campylobacter concisus]|uniref:Endonuclease GajA/Old nuclease/RecF-like AAA domain-containing protein n=1 Tax=Campylobacter concisus ATCC 51562 TaxID=1242969 RepID=U2F7F5_9BACT|nr:AAA family ATPase [Campylobacter concisus]ERJ26207.1 hypothetical protein ATCC51562_166 [Campylobacter concisus ATCC 51562]